MTLLPQPRSIERPAAIATWVVSGAPGSGARSAFAVHRRGWMSDQAAHELADRVLTGLARCEGVTVVRGSDSTPWTPDTEPDNQGAEIAAAERERR